MLKKLTNSTNYQNISCGVFANELISPYANASDLLLTTYRVGFLFVKLNNISKKDIANCQIILRFYNHLHDGDIKFYHFTNSYTESTSRQTLVSEYNNGNIKPMFHLQMSGSSASVEGCVIDVTNELLNCASDNNPYAWIVFHGEIETNHDVSIIPFTNTTYYDSEYAIATILDNAQLINTNSIQEYSCGSYDKSLLNISTGNIVHIYDCYKSNSQINPLSLSICYNKNKKTKNFFVGSDLYCNYQFDIYQECDGYVIEDYLGNRRYYEPIDTSDDDFNAIRKGIRHLIEDEYINKPLYYCYEDASYFFLGADTNNSNIKIIDLFDSSDNHYSFKLYNNRTQLFEITDPHGNKTELNWSCIVSATYNTIGYVINDFNNAIIFYYTGSQLNRIEIDNDSIKIQFTSPQSGQFKIEVFRNDVSSRYFLFNYSSAGLTSVQDSLSNRKIIFIYNSNNKISTITNKYNDNDVNYQNNISYYDGYTVIDDSEGHNQTYYFDDYGRVKTVSDDNGNVSSSNYSEINLDEVIKPVNQEISQNCRRDIVLNHDFENISSTLAGWSKSGDAFTSLSNDSISKGKSLRIEYNSSSTTISQTVPSSLIEVGKTYQLKVWLKASSSSGITIRATKLYTTIIPSPFGNGTIAMNNFVQYPVNISSISNEWECFVSDIFSFSENEMSNCGIRIDIILSSSNSIYIDDIQLEEIHRNRTNLLSHLDFQFNDSNIGTLSNNSEIDSAYAITHVKSKTFTPSNGLNYNPYSIYKSLSISGKRGEPFIFNIFAKCLKTTNQEFKGYIKFTNSDNTDSTYSFAFDNYLSSWQLLAHGVVASKDFTNIEVGISFTGLLSFEINDIQLYKQEINQFIEYDSCGRLSKTRDGVQTVYSLLNSKGLVSAILNSDGSYQQYAYNDANNISTISDNYHQTTNYYYQNNALKPTSTIFTSENITITKTSEYTNYLLSSTTDEFNKTTSFAYDSLKRLSSVTYPNGLIKNHTFNDIDSITKLSSSGLLSNVENNLGYLSDKETLTTLVNIDNISYTFVHDNYHRLIAVKLGNDYINQFTYPSVSSTHRHNKVLTKQYGSSGTTFSFTYDELDRPISISLSGITKYQYTYDEFGYIYCINDLVNNKKTYYFYDNSGLLIKQKCFNQITTYKYDNQNNIQEKIIYNGDDFTCYNYDYEYEDSLNNREKFFVDFARIYDVDLMYFPFAYKGLDGLSPYNLNNYDDPTNLEGFFAYTGKQQLNIDLSTVKEELKIYNPSNYSTWKIGYTFSKSFYLWFKPSGTLTTNVNVMNIFRSSTLAYEIRINALGKLQMIDGSSVLFTSTDSVNLGSYNFLYINFSLVSISIQFNSEYATRIVLLPNFNFENIVLADNYSQYGLDNLPITIDYFVFAVGNKNLDSTTLSSLYSSSISRINASVNTTRYRHLSYFKGNKLSLDYIPLNSHLNSIKGLKPYNFVSPEDDLFSNTDLFGTSLVLSHKKYKCFKTTNTNTYLAYIMPFTNKGTISMYYEKAMPLANQSGYIFSLYRNNCVLSLSKDRTSYTFSFGGQSATVNNSSSKFVSVTFSLSQAKLYLDGVLVKTITLTDPLAGSDAGFILYIGQLGTDKSTALDGYIEGVSFSSNILNASSVSSLYASSKYKTYDEVIDRMGRITSKMLPGSLLPFSSSYSYNLTRLSSETTYKGETYNYSYDSMGNINEISGSLDRTYIYDKLNRLVEVYTDGGQLLLEEFVYDQNSNITSHTFLDENDNQETHTFHYSSSGLLTSVTDSNNDVKVAITYPSNNPLYPSSITLKNIIQSLTWEGNRLIEVGNSISYSYNDQGIRISKIVNNVTTTYRLEDGKIIQMNIGATSLYFRYDFNNVLIGLSDGNNEYYYIRDALGIIHGIMNSNGNYIVKYFYNAYGLPSIEIQSGYEFNIAALNNPFLYKGYYYDDETGLYYCNHRYYYPLICRWISPVSTNDLVPTSLTTINLFAFNSNPILFCANGSTGFPFAMFAKGHQGNMRSSKYLYWTTDELIARLIELNNKGRLTAEEKEEKRDIERELKARGERNKNKRSGYHHSQFSNYQQNGLTSIYFSQKYQTLSINQKTAGTIITIAIVGGAIIYILANDSTGFGIIDDFALAVLIPFLFILRGNQQ